MQQIIIQAGPSRQLFETVNFAFMKIFDFLIKIALFWGLSVFLGWLASQITAKNRVWWLYNQHVDLATELDFRPKFVTWIILEKQKGPKKGLYCLENQKFS